MLTEGFIIDFNWKNKYDLDGEYWESNELCGLSYYITPALTNKNILHVSVLFNNMSTTIYCTDSFEEAEKFIEKDFIKFHQRK